MNTLHKLHENEYNYRGSKEVIQQMGRITLVPFIGASAMGKNFLMEQSGLYIAGNFTTRNPRPDDENYNYYTTDEAIELIQNKEVVQYAVNPPAGTIYGTMPSDYQEGYVAKDVLASAIKPLETKGFSDIRPVSIFTSADQWTEQFKKRCEEQPKDFALARLKEAKHSIDWIHQQCVDGNPHHLLLFNEQDEGLLEENVDLIIRHAKNEKTHQPNYKDILRRYTSLSRTIGRLAQYYNQWD